MGSEGFRSQRLRPAAWSGKAWGGGGGCTATEAEGSGRYGIKDRDIGSVTGLGGVRLGAVESRNSGLGGGGPAAVKSENSGGERAWARSGGVEERGVVCRPGAAAD